MEEIRDLTVDWLTAQDRLIVGELYISRYYPESESELAGPVWEFEVDEDLVVAQPDKFINLLCQNTDKGRNFYHLKFPSGFLSVCRHLLAYDGNNKRFKLKLSADQVSLFRDQNGIGSVNFGIFRVD